MISKLSPIINIKHCESIEDIINLVYEEFKSDIMNKKCRPKLFGKFVFIKFDCWIENKAEIYWHLISLDEEEKFDIYPCENTIVKGICNKNCINKNRNIILKNGQKRSVCIHRAVRVKWIKEIITLANNKDNSIKKWIKGDKLYLRYQCKEIDYVVVFLIKKDKYQLITAFPVFYINKQGQFDNDYEKYSKKIKKPVIALRKLESPSTTW